jgi:curved DNA-binding protein CbpA
MISERAPNTLEGALGPLLAAKASEKASGLVTASRGKQKRIFCLREGWLVFATSNVMEEQFAEALVQRGVLTPSLRASIAAEAAQQSKKPLEFLLERKLVPEPLLRDAMERHVESLLSSSLEWPDGRTSFEGGLPRLDGEMTVQMSVVALLLRHARQYPKLPDALRVRVGPPDQRFVRVEAGPHGASALEADPIAIRLWNQCDGIRTLGELLAASGKDPETALRAIYGLLLAGLATRGESPAMGRPEAAINREEFLARIAMAAGADYYGVLGLERSASERQIRDSYYALARRYHPDRFRSGHLQELLLHAEGYFTRVTEAYNTLSNRERRVEYGRTLAREVREPDAAKTTDTAYLARQNFIKAKSLLDKKKMVEALVFLENAVRLDDSQADYHFELGQLLVRNVRRRGEAEQQLIRAAELDPSRIGPYLALANLYHRGGKNAEAARMFREVLRWDPTNAEASTMLAELAEAPAAGTDPGRRKGIFRG